MDEIQIARSPNLLFTMLNFQDGIYTGFSTAALLCDGKNNITIHPFKNSFKSIYQSFPRNYRDFITTIIDIDGVKADVIGTMESVERDFKFAQLFSCYTASTDIYDYIKDYFKEESMLSNRVANLAGITLNRDTWPKYFCPLIYNTPSL